MRLGKNYEILVKRLSPDGRRKLEKVQRDWVAWRDGSFHFLSERVPAAFSTTRATSLDFLLNSVSDRANEMEMVLDEIGGIKNGAK